MLRPPGVSIAVAAALLLSAISRRPRRNGSRSRPALHRGALEHTPIPSGFSRCYAGRLYLMSQVHVSGEYRIIEPKK